MGHACTAFVAIPQNPPRNVAWMRKGKMMRLAKVAFEKYFIRKMKKGSSEPVFEKYVLKALGIYPLSLDLWFFSACNGWVSKAYY